MFPITIGDSKAGSNHNLLFASMTKYGSRKSVSSATTWKNSAKL